MKTCIRCYLCQISSTDLLVMNEKFSKILESFKILCPTFLIFLSNAFSNISILLQIRLYKQYRLKYLTRLHIGLSHLCEPKFKHSFLDSPSPICSCGYDIASTCHNLFCHHNFSNDRATFLDTLSNINIDILSHNDTTIV